MIKNDKCGIYCWTNKINNLKYIGCSKHIYKRWNEHKIQAKNKSHRKFYIAINEYGIENFDKEIIEECEEIFLEKRELFYINLYNTIENGYNISKQYNSLAFNPNLEVIKEKISKKAKNRRWINNDIENKTINIEEIYNYINNGWKLGRLKFSDNHKKQLSKSHVGITLSDNAKEKLSKLWKGKNHTLETRKLMSNNSKGRYTKEWYINKYGETEGILKFKNHHNWERKQITCINNGIINKMININELNFYLSNGWIKGKISFKNINRKGILTKEGFINNYGEEEGLKRYYERINKHKNIIKGRICVNNGIFNKMICKDELENYLKENWIKGRIKIK